ncbi:Protein of unknown function [Bacillus thuringiensis]|uniref:DUF2187 domain-containing protein n=1 Tax=Bacillus thuringiensis TaxID=1428 RepID=A0A1C4E2V0_BACTU|nr:Protein of unknown function [Bacillus thuringiensis]
MENFKNGDLVLITRGEFKGIPGKVVDNSGLCFLQQGK